MRVERNPRTSWVPAKVAEAASYWREGLTVSEIAPLLGVTKPALEAVIQLNRDQFPLRRPARPSAPKRPDISDLLKQIDPQRSKFNATRVKADGHTFDSKAEHARYCELKLLSASKQWPRIMDLKVHPQWPLNVNGIRVAIYEPDFVYHEQQVPQAPWHPVAEDVKGFLTPEYKIKRNLFKAIHPDFDFRELNTDKSATRKAWTKFAAGRGVQTAAGGGE